MSDVNDIIKQYINKGQDFGFTSVDEMPAVENLAKSEETVEGLKKKLKEVEELVMPLLVNLLQVETGKDEPPAYIHWPNRKKPVQDLINKLVKITR